MAKTKEEKNKIIELLVAGFELNKAALIVDYKGVTVKEIEGLRNRLSEKNISFSVIKNSLLKIALEKSQLEVNKEILNRPLAVSFSNDEVLVSKELTASQKLIENLQIYGGIIDSKYVGEEVIKQLSSLPSREELYARLVGSLNAPISGIVNVMAGNIRNFINVLNNYQNSKS